VATSARTASSAPSSRRCSPPSLPMPARRSRPPPGPLGRARRGGHRVPGNLRHEAGVREDQGDIRRGGVQDGATRAVGRPAGVCSTREEGAPPPLPPPPIFHYRVREEDASIPRRRPKYPDDVRSLRSHAVVS
jgi:hypothetical protein